MLNMLRVLTMPLIGFLAVSLGMMAAIVMLGAVIFWLRTGISPPDVQGAWELLSPVAVAGGTLFAFISVMRWVFHLSGLRRTLKARGVSLRTYSSWPGRVRSAWVKSQGALPDISRSK
jgi:hypothetical protein